MPHWQRRCELAACKMLGHAIKKISELFARVLIDGGMTNWFVELLESLPIDLWLVFRSLSEEQSWDSVHELIIAEGFLLFLSRRDCLL